MTARDSLTRRELLRDAGASAAALALGLSGWGSSGASQRPKELLRPAGSGEGPGRRLPFILDAVFDNPGQAPTRTSFKDPRKLAAWGYDGQVVADWRPPVTAITFERLEPDIFPHGSDALAWVEHNAAQIEARTSQIHGARLKALYHTDMIILPTRLVERHSDEILDRRGRISLERPTTRELLRVALAEVFTRFPYLDGLVIRTGEVYLQDLPYHTGSDPITRGPSSHLQLLAILREEACAKRGKLILYRTWAFDGFTTSPGYYLSVADRVQPHPLLAFSIKHTDGDFWRTVPFNPTLGLGRHQQIVEVQCQREFEGKGAHPNYIAQGVIDGFEELQSGSAKGAGTAPVGLADLAGRPTFAGVFTWSRGGGWNGPYINDELWCELNAYVVSRWAQNSGPSEEAVFEEYASELGLTGTEVVRFRRLALLSCAGVLHGQYSTVLRLSNLAWTRDQYLGGSDLELARDFQTIVHRGLTDRVLAEKAYGAALWQEVMALAEGITLDEAAASEYVRVSSRYGLLLHSIIEHGWAVMLKGTEGDRAKSYDRATMLKHLRAYETAWRALDALRDAHGLCATLYVPYSFRAASSPRTDPSADPAHGMGPSIRHYRRMLSGGGAAAAGVRGASHRQQAPRSHDDGFDSVEVR
jgi:hypothetical protein